MMKNVDRVIDELNKVSQGFWGRIVIKVRDGEAYLLTQEQDTLLKGACTASGAREQDR